MFVYLLRLLDQPPHHLFDVRAGLFGRVRVHRHPGHPLVDAAAARPADVQRGDLGVGHLRPVGGVDPGVGAGGALALVVVSGLGVAVGAVFVEGFPDESDLPSRQEILDVVLLEPHLEGSVPVPEELLQGGPLLLAVVELRPGLRDLLVDVLVVQAAQLRLRHCRHLCPSTRIRFSRHGSTDRYTRCSGEGVGGGATSDVSKVKN